MFLLHHSQRRVPVCFVNKVVLCCTLGTKVDDGYMLVMHLKC